MKLQRGISARLLAYIENRPEPVRKNRCHVRVTSVDEKVRFNGYVKAFRIWKIRHRIDPTDTIRKETRAP